MKINSRTIKVTIIVTIVLTLIITAISCFTIWNILGNIIIDC